MIPMERVMLHGSCRVTGKSFREGSTMTFSLQIRSSMRVRALSRGMLHSSSQTRSPTAMKALWAWPHSPMTTFFTLSFFAVSACLMVTRAYCTSS